MVRAGDNPNVVHVSGTIAREAIGSKVKRCMVCRFVLLEIAGEIALLRMLLLWYVHLGASDSSLTHSVNGWLLDDCHLQILFLRFM